MRIIFMGTPHFAVASLEAIHASQHEVAAVVTSPDRPAGRGRKLRPSAVKEYALKNKLPLLQPEKLRDPDFLAALQNFAADCFVVVAFRMLPTDVWKIPPRGTINLHASLLPNYRGAAPINWAIIRGEQSTGLTTFFIDEAIDTGAIILQKKVPIGADETAGSLHDKMMQQGGQLLLDTLEVIEASAEPRIAQANLPGQFSKAPKIFKKDQHIRFERPVEAVYNHLRGLQPFPGAFAVLKQGETEIHFKFGKSRPLTDEASEPAGTLCITADQRLLIACQDAYLELLEGQPAGKKMLSARDLINGTLVENKSNFI